MSRRHVKKLPSLFAAVVFMTGFAGHALAAEKKAEDKGRMEKPAEAKRMPIGARNANGTVKMAAANSIVVMSRQGRGKDAKEAQWTFAVDDKTMIKKGGKAITAADIKRGDSVQVRYMEHYGRAVAQSVTVGAGGTARKMDTAKKNPCAAKSK